MSETPVEVIRTYLAATGDRRMADASRHLAPDAVLVFPQGRFGGLTEMVEATAGRYLAIDKTYETWDVFTSGDEAVIVTTGTLHGVNTHSIPFSGVRFCDRFVVRSGLITEQHVWNDLAESEVLEQR